MRNIQLIAVSLVLLVASPIYATNYHVDTSYTGSGGSSGGIVTLKTIAEVNATPMGPGDVVQFKRNQLFRGTLNARDGVSYGAYASGNKPLIFRSFSGNNTNDWNDLLGNLWSINVQENLDVGNIIFDWGQSGVGRKVETLAEVNAQDEFYSDPSTGLVTLYSTNKPTNRYGDIELAIAESIINVWAVDNVVIQDLELRNGGVHGINAGGGCHNLQVYNTDFLYIGGAYHASQTPKVRYGNGVEFWAHASGSVVADCFFFEIYDVAMTCQGSESDGDLHNIYFQNNTVSNCEQSFEFWVRGGWNVAAYNIYFQNNTCWNAGSGWSHNQRPFPNGTHVLLWQWDTEPYVNNIVVRNNYFGGWTDSLIFAGTPSYLELASVHDSSVARIQIPITGGDANAWWRKKVNGQPFWKFCLRYVTGGWVNNVPQTAMYADWEFLMEYPLTQN